MTYFDLVGEFHQTFEHPMRNELYTDVFIKNPKLVYFRLNLIEEEYDELKKAYYENDLVEVIDALCDMMYVINGAGHCLGIKTNIDETSEIFNNLKDFNEKNMDEEKKLSEYIEKMGEEINEMRKNINQESMLLINNLIKLMYLVYFTGNYIVGKEKFDECFQEVHRSNMTKVCRTEQQAEETVRLYRLAMYPESDYRKKGEYYVIYDKLTSKILKNYQWETPKLKEILY